jgi:hypothetical protein
MFKHSIATLIFLALLLHISNSAKAQYNVTLPECEYNITFPSEPKKFSYHSGGRPGNFLMTEAKAGLPILRAECQAIVDKSILNDQLVMKSLQEQAQSIGLENIQTVIEHNSLGIVGTFTGRKKASGVEMIQMGRIYVGNRPVMNLLATETLKSFPSKQANTFFFSVRR